MDVFDLSSFLMSVYGSNQFLLTSFGWSGSNIQCMHMPMVMLGLVCWCVALYIISSLDVNGHPDCLHTSSYEQ